MIKLISLQDKDVPLVISWLNNEHVKRWYEIPSQNVSIKDWIYELEERNGEYNWLNHMLVLWNDEPIGMCQYYKCSDSIDEDFGSLPIEGSYGIDYLIGEKKYLGKGLGRAMIKALIGLIFTFSDAQRVTADIDMENKASQGVLLSCGFKLLDKDCSRFVLDKI